MEAAGLYLKILIRGTVMADWGSTNNLEKLAEDQKDVSDPGIPDRKMFGLLSNYGHRIQTHF